MSVNDSEASSSNFICPSKSTVYLGNLNYSLTNNDLIKIVECCGKVVSAKVVKDRVTHKSLGYAFVQFLKPEDAITCVQTYNDTQMFGRTWNCSIAKDNGRSAEFIRKRVYPDKTRCYECGDFGHLSYQCTKNALGDRIPPAKTQKKRKKHGYHDTGEHPSSQEDGCGNTNNSDEDQEDEETEPESLNAAIQHQIKLDEAESYKEAVISGDYISLQPSSSVKKRFVKDGYFSDEEALVDNDSDD